MDFTVPLRYFLKTDIQISEIRETDSFYTGLSNGMITGKLISRANVVILTDPIFFAK